MKFNLLDETWANIEFNLRQQALAISRVVVDVFGTEDPSLPFRLAQHAWPMLDEGGWLSRAIATEKPPHPVISQTAILIADQEFITLKKFFSPHHSFWTTLLGLMRGLTQKGSSATVMSTSEFLNQAYEGKIFEALIIGPLRYELGDAIRARQCVVLHQAPGRCGVMVGLTIGSLQLCDIPVSELLGAFAYRELFNARLFTDRTSNFWEMILTVEDYWSSAELAVHENVLIGRNATLPALLLVTASAQDWIENGDPNSELVLRQFLGSICAEPRVTLGDVPGALYFIDGAVVVSFYDQRVAVRSQGGGIARGWPLFRGPDKMLPPVAASLSISDAHYEVDTAFNRSLLRYFDKLNGAQINLVGGYQEFVVGCEGLA
ncbi:hypothetical protein [Methylocystis iwaonis]|uniref:hypothetical protein n=1 Tax=Methylocystis iwaonis TaxID=2885079 RepID=UPI002E7C4122|nr:hypothetical protein [Methylocystis iwaonis]